MTPLDHWSFSQAKVANSCPLQWKLSRSAERETSLASMQGSIMDEIISGVYAGDHDKWMAAAGAFHDEVDYLEALRDAEAVLQALADVPRGIPQVAIEAYVPGIS